MAFQKAGPPAWAVCLAAGLLHEKTLGVSALDPPNLCEGSQLPPPMLTRLPFVPTEENEERTVIDPTSRDDPRFKELVKVRVSLPVGVSSEGKTLGSGSSGSREQSRGADQGASMLRSVERGETGRLGASPRGAGPRGSQTARLPCCAVPRYTGTLFLRFGTSSCSERSQRLADEIKAFRLFLEREGSSEEALKSGPVGLSGHSCRSSSDGDAPAPGSGQIQPRLDARGQARPEDSHLVPESQGSKGGGTGAGSGLPRGRCSHASLPRGS